MRACGGRFHFAHYLVEIEGSCGANVPSTRWTKVPYSHRRD